MPTVTKTIKSPAQTDFALRQGTGWKPVERIPALKRVLCLDDFEDLARRRLM